jgi:putative colanic acid biosynthesis glycosyltransferase WcaI
VLTVSKAMMQKSGKVVVVSQHYPPDPSTTAAIMAAISERVAREAEVLVLSGTAGSAAAAGKPAVVEVGN